MFLINIQKSTSSQEKTLLQKRLEAKKNKSVEKRRSWV